MSDDGRHALAIIWFVGSVFSPYYHWAGHARPENHVAVNVALYGPRASRWTMTERPRSALERSAGRLSIGPSALAWTGDALVLDLDEVSAPIPRRVRGRITVHPKAINGRSFAIDGAGRHRWMPIAPTARIEVKLDAPALAWSGHAYVDTNAGDEPIRTAFRDWDWSRTELGDATAVLYDIVEKDGAERQIATLFKPDGTTEDFDPPPRVRLGRTGWGIARKVQAEGGARIVRTLEDTPFYARSELATTLLGRRATAVHETLSIPRLDTAIVRLMLPFRMPRRFW